MITSEHPSFGRFLVCAAFCLAMSGAVPAVAGRAASDDYVRIVNGKFQLHGRPFVLRGVNYYGSWRFPHTIDAGDGVKHAVIWTLYHDWDSRKAALDFAFLRSQIRATAVRIGTPAHEEFDNLIKYHGWERWYNPDGSITDGYRQTLVQLADTAYASGVRIQFCLLWNVSNEISNKPDDFAPGGSMDRFYSNQVRSIGLALRDHPGAMAFSVGNEVLIRWKTNGTRPSEFEGRAASFIRRRLEDLRSVAPRQLLTDDEGAGPGCHYWYDPGPDLAMVSDPAEGPQGHPFRLADSLDYLGPHFYLAIVKPADLAHNGFQAKIDDTLQKLADYMKVAGLYGRPIVADEFGLKMTPPDMALSDYAGARDSYYTAFLDGCQKDGLQGLLAWGALPEFILRPGEFTIAPSHLNPWCPIEIDTTNPKQQLLFYEPNWDLFVWDKAGDDPLPTQSSLAIKTAWANIP